jgi:uncharacterized protein (DUF433 family)
MPTSALKVRHPHIVARRGYCGGSPVIAGTKFSVRSVVNYVLRQGMAPEELVAEFRHLSLAQIHDALSYYYDHQKEIDEDIVANAEDRMRSRSGIDRGNSPAPR